MQQIYYFFDTPLLYYYINLNQLIVFCFSSGDIWLSFGISVSLLESFWGELFETFVILSAILLAIESPVTSGFF